MGDIMKGYKNIIWGLLFIIVGIIVFTNSFGITNITIFFDGWWTLFIIVPCFIGLFKDDYCIILDKGLGNATINGKNMSGDTTYGTGENKLDIDGGLGSIQIDFIENR